MSMQKTKRNLILFIIITLASGWIGVLVDNLLEEQPRGNSLGMGLWLIIPFLTVIILRTINRDWKDFGFKPHFKGNLKWYLVALAIYPLVTLITVGIALAFGCVDILNFDMKTFLSLAIISMGGNFIKNIFEEFAWRGYLTPKLVELKANDLVIYIVSGLVWALWHSAYYIVFLPDNYFETISRVGMVLTGCVIMTCWTVMYVEINRLTKSVWPCIIMHAAEDAIPTVLVMVGAFITLTNNSDVFLNPITGVVATILFLTIGFVLRTVRIKKEKTVEV
jgi:membrane protease YdiL (CAAX protease family)